MSKPFLVVALLTLLALQSQALTCVVDSGRPYLSPIGLIVTQTTYELRTAEGEQIGSDFETSRQCNLVISKMRSDRPFVCLPVEQGVTGAISRFLRGGSTYAVFGPHGKQYGMNFGTAKKACEEVAIKGTRKSVCIPQGSVLEYKKVVDGKEETFRKEVFGGYEVWGSGSKRRYSDYRNCIMAAEKFEEQVSDKSQAGSLSLSDKERFNTEAILKPARSRK